MSVRPAEGRDAPAVAALWNHAIRDTLITFNTEEKSETDVAAEIAARRSLFLVAETGGGFAGFATSGPFRANPGYARTHEHAIMLIGAARGQGLGRALLVALEENARAAGIHVLVAAVSSANPGAVEFHQRMGFVHAGTFREVGRKWDRWLGAIFLQRILAP
jgi:L-amino acid N-acyltransferase YncA